jgi:OOP family OmpA-OmpF porin
MIMKTLRLLLAVAFLFSMNATWAQKKDDKSKSEKTEKKDDKGKKEPVVDTDPNEVANGSFEEYDAKLLKGKGQLHLACKPWTSVNKTGADMFAAGNSKNKKINAPDNDLGNQIAQSGNNYAGFIAYSKDPKVNRTYMSQKLKHTLKKDQMYCITYSVCLAENSKMAVNNVGVLLGSSRIQHEDDKSITTAPTIVMPANRPINDMDKWTTVCMYYYAKGNENFITIGGFGNDGDMKFEKIKGPAKPAAGGVSINGAYYYVDNISVLPITAKSECNCGKSTVVETDFIYSRSGAKPTNAKPDQLIAATQVYFGKESEYIPAQFDAELDEVAELLKANPTINVLLTGHADTEEMEEAKVRSELLEIAKRRAESVMEALVSRGVDAGRISIDSKDANELASTKGTPMSKAQNRRVIFSVK